MLAGDDRASTARFRERLVSVEGISLTIAKLRDDRFDLAIIPKTWDVTNLHSLNPGDPVNLRSISSPNTSNGSSTGQNRLRERAARMSTRECREVSELAAFDLAKLAAR